MVVLLADKGVFFSSKGSISEIQDTIKILEDYVKQNDLGFSECEEYEGFSGVEAYAYPNDMNLEDFADAVKEFDLVEDSTDSVVKSYKRNLSKKEKSDMSFSVMSTLDKEDELKRLIEKEKADSKQKIKGLELQLSKLVQDRTNERDCIKDGTENTFVAVILKKDFDKGLGKYVNLVNQRTVKPLEYQLSDIEMQKSIDDKEEYQEEQEEQEGSGEYQEEQEERTSEEEQEGFPLG